MSLRLATAGYAAQLREGMGIGEGEVVGDIVNHIKEAGYHYMEESFGNEFSGFTKSLGGGNYLIGFNRDHFWNDRFRRFTLSHELGHIAIPEHRSLLERDGLHQSKSEFPSKNDIERQADYFAICFLAPARLFLAAMRYKEYTKATIEKLSAHFGISVYATVLRFLELTDLACTLIVCNKDGLIEYENRSERMKEIYRHDFLSKKPVKETTLTFDYIKGKPKEDSCTVPLREWFEDLPSSVDVGATESVIDLGYKGKFLTLLVPHANNLDEHAAEDE